VLLAAFGTVSQTRISTMSIRVSVIEELRAMFKEGATPSRLIQHIVARHPNEGNWHGLIQDYFREGFGVPIVRGLDPLARYDDSSLRYAYLNEAVLHEMVQGRTAWDAERNTADSAESSWLDTMTAKGTLDRIRELEQRGFSELAESWDGLTRQERAALVLTSANLHTRIEMCHILARLVERLQQRIVALERARAEPLTDATSAR
jgi:hypothetical protein